MSDELDFLGGEVSEGTVYQPVPKARYQAVISKAEMVDPVAMGWTPPDDMDEAAREEYLRPYPRFRWQIEAMENGEPTEYAGRNVDMRVSLRSGVNPKTGRSFAENRADLIRLRLGLDAKAEVVGQKLFEDTDLRGLPREESIPLATTRLQQYEGLRGVIRVIHIKNKETGESRDSVGKLVLPK